MYESVLLYILIALYALSALTTIGSIGKPRKPITPGLAVFTLLADSAVIAFLVHLLP